MKKYTYYIVIFLISANPTLAFSWNISTWWEYFFGPTTQENIQVSGDQRRLNIFGINASDIQNDSSSQIYKKQEIKEETYNVDDIKRYEENQKKLLDKINALVLNLEKPQTLNQTCDNKDEQERQVCKQDLFVGCAESLNLGVEMTPECKEFTAKDYSAYLEAKKKVSQNSSKKISVTVGSIYVSDNPYIDVKSFDKNNTINSGTINANTKYIDELTELEERKIIEPSKSVEFNLVNKYNTLLSPVYTGWVSGWGTLFAINGGKKEAGQIMNKHTAFGYNPYSNKVCIVSLPYKTIDKFFGTSLDYCVKAKNLSCILSIKSKIKDRGIEVIMLKNGKRVVLPLGDLGPAEWTGNAIDFTACAKNLLGATGKDLVKFRPVPGRSSIF